MPKKGYKQPPRSKEWCEKISKANKGRNKGIKKPDMSKRMLRLWQNPEARKTLMAAAKRNSPYQEGSQNRNWKGGKSLCNGYVSVISSEVRRNSRKHKYVLEHRVIMEKALGRKLEKWENIHHKNRIKTDNRLENLEIVIKKTHFGRARCPYCLNNFLIK